VIEVISSDSYFEFQLIRLAPLNKPLFLHNRAASADLYEILVKHREHITAGGVVSDRKENGWPTELIVA
jgi:Tat protein secretion system quality control protein TatD with DNase activity